MNDAKISIEAAIGKGKKYINSPLPFVFLGTILLGMYGMKYSLWFIVFSIVGGFVMSWLYWSIAITKWRIWAFSNVENICDLEREAIKHQLIWQRGSIFEKTEIRSKNEKALIENFQKALEKCKEFYENEYYYEELPIPNHLNDIFHTNLDADHSEFVVEGKIVCTCGCENLEIHFVGNDEHFTKDKSIRTLDIEGHVFLNIQVNCPDCKSNYLIFDIDSHGWNGFLLGEQNRKKMRPQAKAWYCRKCNNLAHKTDLIFYSKGIEDFKEETENELEIEQWKDVFSSIFMNIECATCGEKKAKWVDCETM
jgi:DNA-directed RNA polymerase subunit M/transcription elongation factor TFIIS